MEWEYLSVKVSMSTNDPGIRNCDYVVVNHKRSDLVEGQFVEYEDPDRCFAPIKLLEIGEESVTIEYRGETIVVEKGNWKKVSEVAKDYTYFELELDLRHNPEIRYQF